MAKPSEDGALTTEGSTVYALNWQPFYDTMSLSASTHSGPKKTEREQGAGPLTPPPNSPLTTLLLVVP